MESESSNKSNDMNAKQTLLAGSLLGFLGVAVGAFGAHALKPMLLAAGRLDTFELAVRYQFYHAFALLLTGILRHKFPSTSLRYSSLFFLIGIFLFSGSLYAICLTEVIQVALLTPIGGVFLLVGWTLLCMGIVKKVQ